MNESRAEKFVPLQAAATASRNRGDFQVTVLSQTDQAQTLQPVVEKSTVAPTHQSPACEPKISLQREGERITAIQIECTCGRIIELGCVY